MKMQQQRIDSIIQFSFGLDEEIDRINLQAYHFKGFQDFCLELKKANKALRQIFLDELEYLTKNGIFLKFAVFNEAIDAWYHLRMLVNIVEDVRMDNFPKETMRPFSEFIVKNGLDCEIFASDMDDWNFSFWEFWINFKEKLIKLGQLDLSKRKRVLYKFPKFQRDNILLGTIMAHEFGHYLDLSEYKTSQLLYGQVLDSADFQQLHNSLEGLLPGQNVHSKKIISSILYMAKLSNRNIALNWIRELFADIFGALFYGPAFFFAQAELRLERYKPDTNTTNEYFDHFVISHPPDTIRNKAIYLTLSKTGVMNEITGALLDKVDMYRAIFEVPLDKVRVLESGFLKSSWPGIQLRIDDDFYKILFGIIDKNLEHFVDEALSVFPSNFIFDSEAWKISTNKELQDKILNLVPPNELGNNPVPLTAIINSAWVAYYLQFDQLVSKYFTSLSTEERRFKVFQTLSSLIRKALDSAYIHIGWNERSRQP